MELKCWTMIVMHWKRKLGSRLPPETLNSHLVLEKQPLILDPITVLTATNLSFITPSKNTNRPISLFLIHFFSSHCTAFNFLSCIVLFCCTVHYCLFSFLIFSLLSTSSIKLNLNLNLILRPSLEKKIVDDLFKGQSISSAVSRKRWPVCAERSYLADFWSATCSASAPLEWAAMLTYELATMYTSVTSHCCFCNY